MCIAGVGAFEKSSLGNKNQPGGQVALQHGSSETMVRLFVRVYQQPLIYAPSIDSRLLAG